MRAAARSARTSINVGFVGEGAGLPAVAAEFFGGEFAGEAFDGGLGLFELRGEAGGGGVRVGVEVAHRVTAHWKPHRQRCAVWSIWWPAGRWQRQRWPGVVVCWRLPGQ
ncbi:hypothetical protein CSW53_07970 [Rhodococcus ruber]|nr:hypothetical protein CSW53_07970 [Rhodococcus ruber]